MYKEKLDMLFQRASEKQALNVIENLKALVRYQNFCIEEQILFQARNNGISIPDEMIKQKDIERISEHDKVIDACLTINEIARAIGTVKIFDVEPNRAENQIAKYDSTEHAKTAYIVAHFINEYYDLSLEMERYDRVLDSTTFEKTKTIREKEWFGASAFDLPTAEFYPERLNKAVESIHRDVTIQDAQLENFRRILRDQTGQLDMQLKNGVKMTLSKEDGYTVTLETRKPFRNTSGVLTNETTAGFEPQGDNKMCAKDIVFNQLKDIVKQNGGFSYQTCQEYDLDEGIGR